MQSPRLSSRETEGSHLSSGASRCHYSGDIMHGMTPVITGYLLRHNWVSFTSRTKLF